ncbi:MBG domain-containing protein [Ekhidna sp.]|uniref:MBG domain-containing protein n=1 Tax=Ekhidna sp. TaxID=2608089 RepID=UPI003CCBECF3
MKTTTKLPGSMFHSGRLALLFLSLFITTISNASTSGGGILSEIDPCGGESDPCEDIGDTKTTVENSPSIDAGYALVSKMGDDLLISYYDYNDWSTYTKKVDTDGVVTDMVAPSVSPRANDGSETIIYHGLENGNIVVIWYSSSSSKGLTDTYFKIIDESGSEVKAATKINTLAGSLNRFTKAEQLSNGNILFTWATDGGNYAMRRFTSSGVAVDANQISLTSLAGLTGTSQYAYNVAANDNGRFMVFIENYSSYYYGMIFENDASTPIQVGGQNSFITGQVTSSGHGDKVTHVSTLSTGQFLLVYQVQDGGGTSTRSIAYKVYNDDGTVAVNEVIRRQVYSWGYIGEPIITNDGFILTYTYNDLGYGPGLYTIPYLEYFTNSGSYTQDMSSCLPSFEGEYGEAQVFADVDGSIGIMMNDTEGSFDYNIWLLRQSDVGGPSTSAPELTTADAESITNDGATLNGEVTSDGGGTVSYRGFVYGTSPDPVIGDGRSIRVDVGNGVGAYSQEVGELSAETTYNVKAFAINEFGTSYGAVKSFTTLSKQSQTITFNAIPEKTYGDDTFSLGNATTDQGLTVVYSADDNSIVSISGNQATILKAGTTTINATQAGDDDTDAATPVDQTLVVNKKTLTVAAQNQSKTYGTADPTNAVAYEGFVDGEDASDVSGELSYSRESGEDVGTYAITPGGLTSANYAITFEAGELNIGQKALTVTAQNQSKEYGSADPANAVAYEGFVDGEDASDLSGELSYSRESGEDVGTYAITPSGLTSANYAITFETGELNILQKTLTVTAQNQSKTYGSADPTNAVSFEGFIDGEDAGDLSGELSYSRESGEDVGTYAITPSGLTSANYAITFEAGELNIGQKALTVTAQNQSKEYGSADPTNAVAYEGFVDGEDASDLSGELSYSRESGEDVGTYAITPSGLTSANYAITFEAGELNIGQKALTITAQNQSKTYGSADPANAVAYESFVDGEDASDLSGELSYSRESGEDVGTYAITPGGLTSANYAITFEAGELNIGQKALTVTAQNQNKAYGSSDPTNAVSFEGFVDGEDVADLSGELSYSRESGEDVGTYAITPSGLISANYAITFEAGELSIGQKALTVTAQNQSKTYGSADPANAVAYEGFVDGEDVDDLSGELSYSRESGEDVGTYAITPSGLTSANYAISFEAGELSIGQKALTVTAQNQSKTYGSADPTNAVAYEGFVDGEDASDLSGELSYSRESGEDVGTYAITPSGLTSANYAITFEAGELNIGQKALTVAAQNQSKTYGSADPTNAVAYEGFVDGEDASNLSGELSYSRESGEDVGTYAITPSGLTSANYAITFEAGELNIGQKALTVTAQNQSKTYGSEDPTNSVSFAGFVDGEDESELSGTLSFNRESGEDVGTYAITPSGLTSLNYDIIFEAGELSVTQKQLTVSNPLIDPLKVYDGTRVANVQIGTLQNAESGDDVSVNGEALYDDKNVGTDKTITVTYSISGTDARNYLAPEDYSIANGVIEQDFAPAFTSSNEFTINENEEAIATLTATDENTSAALNYSLTGGSDKSLFEIESATGVLSFATTPDFENLQDADENAVYEVEVSVSDGANSVSMLVKVTVVDVNDNAPVITSSQSFLVDDRAQNGSTVGTISATDADSGTTLSGWTIKSGDDSNAFSLDSESGELTVNDRSKLDKNVKSGYTISVQVNDGLNTSLEETILISLEDSEAPQAVLSVEIGTITNTAPIQVTAKFSEAITGFSPRDIRPNNARASNLKRLGPDLYTFDLLPFDDGVVEVILGRGSVRDASGNPSGQSNLLSFFYDATSPEATFTSDISGVSNKSDVEVTVSFSEIIESVSAESFTVSNAEIVDFGGDFGVYTMTLAPIIDGIVEVQIESGKVQDEAGNGNTNASFSWEADFSKPINYQTEILTDAISTLNETSVSFKIENGEAGASYEYQFSSSNGTKVVTGYGSMVEASTTVSGVDVSGLSDGDITLTVTLTDVSGNKGEPVSDKITKDTEVNIPQGFSPNGDGIDDNWIIPGIEDYPENRVTIYNRYGKKVWSIEGYNNTSRSWASTSNASGVIGSNNLPDGTYFYILEFPNSGRKSESGYVIIKK